MKFETKIIHSSFDSDEHNGALMPPIYQNSVFKQKKINDSAKFKYSRLSNPTRLVLEETIEELEEGIGGCAYSSGIAAIDNIFRTLLNPGDIVLATENIYGGTYDLLTKVYTKYNIKTIFIDCSDYDNIANLMDNQKIKLLWLETPSNPLLQVIDIKKLCILAKKHNILVGIDNTFATPYLQKPLKLGADIVIHSATKYLAGHSDVMLGLSVCKDKDLANSIRNMLVNTGMIAAPMDCFLTLRGIKTLAVRMDRHQENAMQIAKLLLNNPKIERVFYPGLENSEGHEIAKEQMKGFGAVVSIYLKKDTIEAANKVIENLKIISLSSSLGGIESLINHSYTQSHSGMDTSLKEKLGIKKGLLRISVGIEDVEDIYQDLNYALNQI